MRVGVVVTTYRRPDALALVLDGYAAQARRPDEILVADDGSGEDTRNLLRRKAAETALRIRHVWHEDRGFRKTEILDRAIRAAESDYLIFTDGDCVPRSDFVAVHEALARPDAFLSGGYVRLSAETTERLTREDVVTGRAFDPAWLTAHGTTLGRHRFRLLRSDVLARLMDLLSPTRPTFNGMSSSAWVEHLRAVNGFDLDFRYGGLDRELGLRLENSGVAGRRIRHRAVVLHLHHDRPYRDADTIRLQRERRARVRRDGIRRAERGIDQLDDTVERFVEDLSPAVERS